MGLSVLGAELLGAGISALGGIGSSVATGIGASKQNRRMRQFAREQADVAHERTKALMDKQYQQEMDWQTMWNTPAAQRRLLQDAGYNPNALFSSGMSSTSYSGGSPSGSQADTPSQAFPTYGNPIDPFMISALADANLKEAQAKKVDSENEGVQLDNDYKTVQNGIYKELGRIKEVLSLDKMDVERALADEQRLLYRSMKDLNQQEYYSLRPLQAAKLSAETFAANADTFFKNELAFKTRTEKDYIVKNFILQQQVAKSTMFLNYANGYLARTQGDLWQPDTTPGSPKGLMYRHELNKSGIDFYNYKRLRTIYDDFNVEWKNSMRSFLEANHLHNYRAKWLNDSDVAFGFTQLFRAIPISQGFGNLSPMPLGGI